MKKKIISVLIIFVMFFFLLPNKAGAASCTSQNGHCGLSAGCSIGTPIVADDCVRAWTCCPNITATCSSLGGHCEVAYTCSQGTPLNGTCPALWATQGFQVCCQPLTSANVLCGNGKKGIDTAIGCIPVLSPGSGFSNWVLAWAIGIGGGIAFLLIVYGGFMVMTSAGNPERLKAGQELLTSAISGLLLLVFSVFVLNFIGINLLGIFK